MLPKSRFSKPLFGRSAVSPKLDRPHCKRFWDKSISDRSALRSEGRGLEELRGGTPQGWVWVGGPLAAQEVFTLSPLLLMRSSCHRPNALQSLREETEGKLQMLFSPRKNGLKDSLFKEVRAFKHTQATWRLLANNEYKGALTTHTPLIKGVEVHPLN